MRFILFQYLAQVLGWRHACEHTNIPSTIEELEEALQQHQALIETISQGYAEVRYQGEWGVWVTD